MGGWEKGLDHGGGGDGTEVEGKGDLGFLARELRAEKENPLEREGRLTKQWMLTRTSRVLL